MRSNIANSPSGAAVSPRTDAIAMIIAGDGRCYVIDDFGYHRRQ
jgi:hypothetical protein